MGIDDVQQGTAESADSKRASSAELVLKSLSSWNWKGG